MRAWLTVWGLGLLLLAGIAGGSAQYVVRSPYLAQPERAIPYVDSCASFWFQAYDSVNGGFYTNIDRTGKVITAWGTNKNLISQTRDAYGFTRAFMLTGNETYLVYARRALDFMYAHLWDNNYGGWYNNSDMFGTPIGPTAGKTAFDQHYALLGPAAYYEATCDSLDWRWLMNGYASNERFLWDPRPDYAGYYSRAAFNWTGQTGKSFNATVDAITTHVLSLYLMTGADVYRNRLLDLARDILLGIVPTMAQQAIGFVENYHTDWTWDNSTANDNTRTIMGHMLKTAWCLARIHQVLPDPFFVDAAERLADNVLAKGYDHAFGGPYKDYDRTTGQMLMYGQDTAKAWWQMEQAITGGLMLHDVTGKATYLQMADETLDFFMKYFVDHQYGEVYADRTRRGAQVWGLEKGSSGKAAYHSTELGYYVYLYGKLLLKREAVTLHYRFASDTVDRVLRMNPVAAPSTRYRLKQILRNGAVYTDFNGAGRLLHLPPGTGGHFAVTYEPVPATAVVELGEAPGGVALAQNYPNPFNPVTTIRYRVPVSGAVTLKVFDQLGREVSTLIDGESPAGEHSIVWNAGGLASGVYYYRLSAGTVMLIKSMLLVK